MNAHVPQTGAATVVASTAAERPSAWVLLRSGRRLDLFAPTPDAWTDEDLALSLARVPRWAGQSRWDRPLTVAQHSLLVLTLREQEGPLAPAIALRELLHDADEAWLGEVLRPVKPYLGDGYLALACGLQAAIAARYRLPPWTAPAYAAHKRADHVAAASEAVHVIGWAVREVADVLGIQAVPRMLDPLPPQPGCAAWEPWPAALAASRFLVRLRALLQAAGVAADPACPAAVPEQAPAGSGPAPTRVYVESGDHQQSIEGEVIGGERCGRQLGLRQPVHRPHRRRRHPGSGLGVPGRRAGGSTCPRQPTPCASIGGCHPGAAGLTGAGLGGGTNSTHQFGGGP